MSTTGDKRLSGTSLVAEGGRENLGQPHAAAGRASFTPNGAPLRSAHAKRLSMCRAVGQRKIALSDAWRRQRHGCATWIKEWKLQTRFVQLGGARTARLRKAVAGENAPTRMSLNAA